MSHSRSLFLRGGIAAAAFATLPRTANAAAQPDFRGKCSLVLSGGGARGAYEVGAIAELVRAAGLRDGQPFPGIDTICGTSIGALIGYFVATAQYTKLFRIWSNIHRYRFFDLKSRYRAIVRQDSGLMTRFVEAIQLARGLTKNEKGILDGERFSSFVEGIVHDQMPLVTPFMCTATSLTRQSATVFYALPTSFKTDPARAASVRRALSLTAGAHLDVREAQGILLSQAIRASATIPIMLDPVEISGPNGLESFIDGGIADNTPIDIARALSRSVKVILVDPAERVRMDYSNALQIGVGAFEIAQRRMVDTALRSAAIESAYGGPFPATIEILQPDHELPLQLLDFDQREKIEHALALGASDAQRGFVPYRLQIERNAAQ